jgi:hypothetical protein
MTITAEYAEGILLAGDENGTAVGGFSDLHHQQMSEAEWAELDIDTPAGYRLIGHTWWADFEEGTESFLFVDAAGTYHVFQDSHSPSAHPSEVHAYWSIVTIHEWLEIVLENIEEQRNLS